MSKSSHPIADIAARLNERIVELAHMLLGQPNKALSTSAQLRYGNHGSVAIEIQDPKRGQWFDHEQDKGGAGLELICAEMNLDTGAACEWALDWLGLSPLEESGHAETSNSQPSEHASKIADIIGKCIPIEGTPTEKYLHRRGITMPAPDIIRYRPRAFGDYGAMVALATDAGSKVLALQQIYLTDDGQKAPIKVVKRTNKAIDGWAQKSAVRLSGNLPIILAEGVETALSIWQATGQETWACLGISNMGNAPLPEKASVILARDGDLPGSKANTQIMRAISKLASRGHPVSIATPPEGKDFNDLLRDLGADAVRASIAGAILFQADTLDTRTVLIGSDVEIANRIHQDLVGQHGEIVHAEGEFWLYGDTHWEIIPEHELRLAAHIYDGAYYETPKGEPSRVKLGKGRVDSILHELATLLTGTEFFASSPVGINCASGFIRFASDGTPDIELHQREHRARHTLPGHWPCPPEALEKKDTFLSRLLDGVFEGDADASDKNLLLAEVCGSAALGYATKVRQPRAAILKGEKAENGKSQILDLARGLLPASAICSISAARMGDERHVIGLVSKLLNASDELSSAAAIASDTFKAIITGEPVDGRDVYKSRIDFRAIAQHIFATNTLPPFQGGMDRGVQRRVMVVTFNRIIPLEERIEAIGRRIAEEEADLLLAWAVDGASRLIRQRNFTIPPSSRVALTDWILGADPVLAWLDECVETKPIFDGHPSITTREAYEKFREWAIAEGFKNDKLPAINGFVQRVQANATGIEYKRTRDGRMFIGMAIRNTAVSSPPPPSAFSGDAEMTDR